MKSKLLDLVRQMEREQISFCTMLQPLATGRTRSRQIHINIQSLFLYPKLLFVTIMLPVSYLRIIVNQYTGCSPKHFRNIRDLMIIVISFTVHKEFNARPNFTRFRKALNVISRTRKKGIFDQGGVDIETRAGMERHLPKGPHQILAMGRRHHT